MFVVGVHRKKLWGSFNFPESELKHGVMEAGGLRLHIWEQRGNGKHFQGRNMCFSMCRSVICFCQPAVFFWAEWDSRLKEADAEWVGGEGARAGTNPPVPHGVCPAPSQLHQAASSVVGPLERYKSLWMLSAQTTHCPPSRDYSFLNEAARRRV